MKVLSINRIVWLIALLMVCAFPACNSTPPEVSRERVAENVELRELISNAQRFHGSRVRVRGVSRIEFESNALYLDADSYRARDSAKALWLEIGWPPREGQKELDGKTVSVEAMVDANRLGHDSAFRGSLVNVSRIETAP